MTVYQHAFRHDPVLQFFLNSVDKRQHDQLRPQMFTVFLECGALNEGLFYHAVPVDGGSGGGCRALVMKPGKSIDGTITGLRAAFRGSFSLLSLGPGVLKVGQILSTILSSRPYDFRGGVVILTARLMQRIFMDVEGPIHKLRKKTFVAGQQFYYVASIATDEADRDRSL